mmetsp:Transcript_84090/g.234542  ORF Transcript_84090/g.234542 Transcript_84090/m.234542 type:complete len:211 (+) Transcript_84090:42-674(+)
MRSGDEERLADLGKELRERRRQLEVPPEDRSSLDSDEEAELWKSQFDVRVYDEGEESEFVERSSGEFEDSEDDQERLIKYIEEQAEKAAREREKEGRHGDDGLRPRRRPAEPHHPGGEAKSSSAAAEEPRKKKKAPPGYDEVTEEEYWRRMKTNERSAAFLGFGPVGLFCFLFVCLMGCMFGFVYLSIYARDPHFFNQIGRTTYQEKSGK